MIPDRASVVAQASLAPHLSQRDQIHILKPGAPDADYVIVAIDLDPWPVTREDIDTFLRERRQRGYEPVFEQNGWVVFRRSPMVRPSDVR